MTLMLMFHAPCCWCSCTLCFSKALLAPELPELALQRFTVCSLDTWLLVGYGLTRWRVTVARILSADLSTGAPAGQYYALLAGCSPGESPHK